MRKYISSSAGRSIPRAWDGGEPLRGCPAEKTCDARGDQTPAGERRRRAGSLVVSVAGFGGGVGELVRRPRDRPRGAAADSLRDAAARRSRATFRTAPRMPPTATSSSCVCPLVVEERDENRGLRKWGRSYTPLWQALGRVGVQTTVVVARSAADPVGAGGGRDERLGGVRREPPRGPWHLVRYAARLRARRATPPRCSRRTAARRASPAGAASWRRPSRRRARKWVRGVAKTEELVLEEVPA